MATEIITALGFDKTNITNKTVVISEQNDAKSSFLLSCILSERCKANSNILLITFQNTYRHYYYVGMKLGYNLDKLKENGHLIAVEPFKEVVHSLDNEDQSSDNYINFLDIDKSNIILKLQKVIKTNLEKLSANENSVCLIIEDVSHLLDFNVPIKEIIQFKQFLQNLKRTNKNLSMVISTAVTNDKLDYILFSCFRHVSDLSVDVCGLKTGKSNLVSGLMKISRLNSEGGDGWSLQSSYHYKLYDRYIRLFAPGTAPI